MLLSVIPGFTERNAPLSCPANVMFGDSARQAHPSSGAPGAAEAVVFVDPAVDDYASLLDSLVPKRLGEASRGLHIEPLDPARDGIAQITEVLTGYQGVAAVHIISHGASGILQLGNLRLDASTLNRYADQLAAWGSSMAQGGDVLLYGCEIARGEEGASLVARLAELTRADVAASVDLTGNAALGGDWDLEYATGPIQASMPSDAVFGRYAGVLGLASVSGNELLFDDAGTEVNQITISMSGPLVVLHDAGTPVAAGAGVTPVDAYTVSVPAAALTSIQLNTGAGADTVTAPSPSPGFNGPLTVDDIDDVTLGTIELSGNLVVSAVNTLTVPDGVTISSQFGDVTLKAKEEVDLSWYWGFSPYKEKQSNASVTIGDATITGRNVSITTLASTAKTLELTESLAYDTRAVVLGDVNGDSYPDLIQGNYDGPLLLHVHNGTSNPFQDVQAIQLTTTVTADSVTSLALGDVTGDGRPDLVVGTAGLVNHSKLYVNDGDANPFDGTVYNLGPAIADTRAVALADFNGDGLLDLALGNHGQFSTLYINDGTGNPFDGTSYDFGTGADDTTAMAVADVNQDGRIDLVLGNSGMPGRLYLNDGAGNPFDGTVYDVGGTDLTTAVVLADFTGDGRPDLAVGNDGAPRTSSPSIA